jgi:acetyltransferase
MPPGIRDILGRAQRTEHGLAVLDEVDSKALLRAYGLSMPAERVVASSAAAQAAAEEIGYPLVLKLLSHEITHKSDVGGVMLGLQAASAVGEAFTRMAASLARRASPVSLDRALLARQVTDGIEVVLGVQRDPEVGPVVMFGGGGTLLELYKDVAFGPAPLAPEVASAMIDRTRIGGVLDGYRGAVKRDRAAIVAALVALGRLADDLRDRIESVDVNPFAVLADGCGGLVLDALVVLRGVPES